MFLVKGLPLAYNRDLQEDKEPLFDAHDTVDATLELAAALIEQTRLNRERIAARLEDGFLDATTLMELFIAKGVPMRTAHEAVGKLVRLCEERHCRLTDLPATAFDDVQAGLSGEVGKVLGVANAVKAFRSAGSTAPAEVERELKEWQVRVN
jgi:argininosuccinate lyase